MLTRLLVLIAVLVLFASHTGFVKASEIHEAARDGDMEKVKAIIEADPALISTVDEGGMTPLHLAAVSGHVDLARWLVENGADVKIADNGGDTPLHFAIFSGDVELAKMILDRGAPPEVAELLGNTQLTYAAYVGSLELVKLLHSRGSSLDYTNLSKQVPLHFATRTGNVELIKYFVENGTDINWKDHFGRQALFFAKDGNHRDAAEYLEANGGRDDYKIGKPELEELAPDFFVATVPYANRTNTGVLLGDKEVLLVDTGSHAAAASLATTLEELGAGSVRAIINTHLHADHNGADQSIDSTATIISFATIDTLVTDGILSTNKYGSGGPGLEPFDQYYSYQFEGKEVRIFPAPGAHSESDVIIQIPELNVVCMGSLLISDGYPGLSFRKIEPYLSILDATIDFFPDESRFVAGHGRHLDKKQLKEYRKMVLDTVEAVNNEKLKGNSLDQIQRGNVLNEWSDYGKCYFLPYSTVEVWSTIVYWSN